jgi:hypothetical protein
MRLNLSELSFEVLAACDIALHRAADLFICGTAVFEPLTHAAYRPKRRERC